MRAQQLWYAIIEAHTETGTPYMVYIAMCVCVCVSYEREGRGRRTVRAQQLWYAIIEAQTETGTPYMVYIAVCVCLYQLRARGPRPADGEGPAAVVRHHRGPDGDGHPLHALQGRLQQQEQPAEHWHHQVQQPLYGGGGVQQCRGGESRHRRGPRSRIFICINIIYSCRTIKF